MHPIPLPGTDLTVSPLCLGTGSFGSDTPEAEAFALLDAFAAAGGRFVDTARIYAAWLPHGANASERTLGAWLRRSGRRAQMVVATKGAHPDLATMHRSRLAPDDLAQDIDASLHYLQIDTIDLYWLHRDDPAVPVGEIIDALNTHIQAGRLRYLGCSNWTAERIRAANAYAQARGLAGFVANQPMWSLAEPNRAAIADKTLVIMDAADRAFHAETGMAVVPYTSQARGYFTKLERGTLRDADIKQYDSPLNRARFRRAQELAARHGTSVTAAALSYLMSQPFPVIPIIGPKSLAQLNDCLQFADWRLTADERAYLEGG
jgi:aryl-alcohol dehydrogenase-like predicted oxidoreductase